MHQQPVATLPVAAALLRAHGDLAALAADLLGKKADPAAILSTLGIEAAEPYEACAQLLLDILEPLSRLEADDLKLVRMFALGVLRWTPGEMNAAALADIADAWDGYAAVRMKTRKPPPPEARFLAEMMKRYPDTRRKTP